MDFSALITLQRDGFDIVEVDGLSRILEVEGKQYLCVALEHGEQTLGRVGTAGHEGGTVWVIESRELFLEGIGLDASANLNQILGGQENDGGCCRRHVGDGIGLLDKLKYGCVTVGLDIEVFKEGMG